jgi:hypothetical protein
MGSNKKPGEAGLFYCWWSWPGSTTSFLNAIFHSLFSAKNENRGNGGGFYPRLEPISSASDPHRRRLGHHAASHCSSTLYACHAPCSFPVGSCDSARGRARLLMAAVTRPCSGSQGLCPRASAPSGLSLPAGKTPDGPQGSCPRHRGARFVSCQGPPPLRAKALLIHTKKTARA